MFQTDYTPLKDPQLNKYETNNKNNKGSFYRYLLLICSLFIIVGIIGYQYYNHHQTLINSPNQILAEKESTLILPQGNNKELVTIEYDINDLPRSILDISTLDSPEMTVFHNKLIEKHGYNSPNYDVQFFVMDRDNEENINDQSDESNGRLKCGTMFRWIYDSQTFLQIKCETRRSDPLFTITGCIGYERDSDGFRWGESGYLTSECYTHSLDPGYTALSGRCCKVVGSDNNNYISTVNEATYVLSGGAFCLQSVCKPDEVAVGCTANDGWANRDATFSGVERINIPNDAQTGCKAQRSDAGFLAVYPVMIQ